MIDLTLYDLMGEDHEIYANALENKQIVISIINESGDEVYNDQTHQYAWDSLVSFARQILSCDQALKDCDEEHE